MLIETDLSRWGIMVLWVLAHVPFALLIAWGIRRWEERG